MNERPQRTRREATPQEAKALAHPLRLRILRLCGVAEMTNKQLADAGLLEQAPVRAGESGALEKPYRSTGQTWWLDGPLNDADAVTRFGPIETFQEELKEAGPESVQYFERFLLHLSPEEAQELDRRILEVLDEYVETDHQRPDRPALNGIFVLHRFAG